MTELMLTVAAGSVLGSLHCVGMCGPFVAVVSGDTTARAWAGQLTYHAGRGITYVALGALFGALGSAVNLAALGVGVGEIAAVVAGGLIIFWGALQLLAVWRPRLEKLGGRRLSVPRGWTRLVQRLLAQVRGKPPVVRGLLLGLSSTLLPCGWLYGFALTAAGTGGAASGAAVMAAFWVGTLPALLGLGLGLRTLAGWLRPRLGWLMPVALIAMGLVTIAQRHVFATLPTGPNAGVTQPCH